MDTVSLAPSLDADDQQEGHLSVVSLDGERDNGKSPANKLPRTEEKKVGKCELDDSLAFARPSSRRAKRARVQKRTAKLKEYLLCSGCPGPSTPKDLWGLCCTRQGRTRLLRPLSLYLLAARQTFASQMLWRSSAPVIFAGLCSALICEAASAHSPRYNTIVMLAFLAATEYPNFPAKSVRPQITLAIIAALSCALDLFHLLVNPALAALLKALLAVTVAGKGAALFTYLTRARNTMRARKYLVRRIRLFGIPLTEPRRLGRDIRGRFLALGLLQLLCCLCYLSFFIALVTSMGYSEFFFTSRVSGVSLPTFVLLKSITSFSLFVFLALDSDLILTLAYFGCLGWMMRFVKGYTRKKRLELGGWPYPYFYNETRYTLFIWGKILDCLWGLIGWVLVGATFGSELESLNTLLILVILTLFLSDIWTPLLMLGINWLLRRRRSLQENEVLSDSDDSELDELAVRDTKSVLPRPKGKQRHKHRRLQKLAEEARGESTALGLLVSKCNLREAELGRMVANEIADSFSSSTSDVDSESSGSDGSLFGVTNNPLPVQFTSSRCLVPPKGAASDGFWLNRNEDKPGNDVRLVSQLSLHRSVEAHFLCNRSGLTFSTPPMQPSCSSEMTLDFGCTVEPAVFDRLWLQLVVDVAFTANIAPFPVGGSLSLHLAKVGFFVVANGESGHGTRVSAFGAGRFPALSREVDDRCLCLIECTLTEVGGKWNALAVNIRCTQSRHATLFVQKLCLGDLFDLVGQGESLDLPPAVENHK